MRAIALDKNNVSYLLNYFSFLIRNDQYTEAKRVYKKAFNISPDVILRYYIVDPQGKDVDFRRIVEEVFWEEISENPKNLRLYYYLGRWYLAQGFYSHALAVCRKAKFAVPESKSLSREQKFWQPRIERQIEKIERLMRKRMS
jgi:tetratricopeptide (TPR) repeat protein